MCSKEFLDKFWGEKIEWKNQGDLDGNHKVVRCQGQHYWIGSEGLDNKQQPLGHGGRKVRITFTDGPHKGQVVDTNNLWSQGDIDPEYIEQLPDNAEIDWMYHWKQINYDLAN